MNNCEGRCNGIFCPVPKVWGYDCATGPSEWVSMGFSNCGAAKQIPIDIRPFDNGFGYSTEPFESSTSKDVVKGFVTNMTVAQEQGSATYTVISGGMTFNMPCGNVRCSYDRATHAKFHSPSQHALNGYRYPLEMVVKVESTSDEHPDPELYPFWETGFVSVFFEGTLGEQRETEADETLSSMLDMAAEDGAELGNVDLSLLVSTESAFFQYSGFSPYPPCMDYANQIVIAKATSVKQSTIAKFVAQVGFAGNARNPIPMASGGPTPPCVSVISKNTIPPVFDYCENNTDAPVPAPVPPPTMEPSPAPTLQPTPAPSLEPSPAPTLQPTPAPSLEPSPAPTLQPIPAPSLEPSPGPTLQPTQDPSVPSTAPTKATVEAPTEAPAEPPAPEPTQAPTVPPAPEPTPEPTEAANICDNQVNGEGRAFALVDCTPVWYNCAQGVAFPHECSQGLNGEVVYFDNQSGNCQRASSLDCLP